MRCLPVIVLIGGGDAGSGHGDGRDLNLLTLTLDVNTANAGHIGVDRLEDGGGRRSNDLLLWVSRRVTWLHAWQEARRGGGVHDEVIADVVGEDVNELISHRRDNLLSIVAAKVGVNLKLQLFGAALGDKGLEEVRDGLVGLAESLDEVES